MVVFPSGQRGQTQDLMRNASWVRIPPLSLLSIAQLVERGTVVPQVIGSNPVAEIFLYSYLNK